MIAVAEQTADLRHASAAIFLQLVHRQVARVRDVARAAPAPQIDGVRTRIRESSPFRAGLRDRGPIACKVPPPTLKSILHR